MRQDTDCAGVVRTVTDDASLARDERGAIMVMGIFMAMLMVGFIYYVAGLGETILFRERVQDASDAAAWSSAVLHARGMNIVALINMIMSSIAAVLLALNMLIAALKVAILIGEVLQAIPFTAPVGAAIVGVAEPLKQAVETCRDSVKEITDEVLPLLTKANRAVRAAIPVVAELKVVALVRESWRDTADFGMFYGKTLLPEPTLPLEDDQCERLEEHGEDVINGLLRGVLGNGVLADIMEKVMDALGTVASYSEGSLCGAGSHGGPNSAAATTQILGEECADNPAISTQTLAQCISAGQMFCWGSSSSNDYPHYDDMGSHDGFHEMCNTLPDHTCGEIEHCADALQRAGQNQDDDSDNGDTDLGGEIAPQRVMSDAYLGGDWFQIRGVIFGEPGHLDAALRGVSKGNWGRSVRDEQLGNLEFLSRLGVSEAEFYFDVPGADARRDDWMWNMQWRARMRRFSLGDTTLLTDACSGAGGGSICSGMMAVSGALTNALAH